MSGSGSRPRFFGASLYIDHGNHFQEKAQFGNLGGFHHNVNAIEIAKNDGFENEVLDVRTILIGYLGKFFLELCGVLAVELLHTVYADFVERFEDVHSRKKERAGATGRVKYSYFCRA